MIFSNCPEEDSDEEGWEEIVEHGGHQVMSKSEMRRVFRLPIFSPKAGQIYWLEGKSYVYDPKRDVEPQRHSRRLGNEKEQEVSENDPTGYLELQDALRIWNEIFQTIFLKICNMGDFCKRYEKIVNDITIAIDREKRSTERCLMQAKLLEYNERWKKTIEDKKAMDYAVVGARDKLLRNLRDEDHQVFIQTTTRMVSEYQPS